MLPRAQTNCLPVTPIATGNARCAPNRFAIDSRPGRARVHGSTRPWPASVAGRLVLPVCTAVVFAPGSASAQTSAPGRISITVEGLNVWQQRNDVRIPPDTGTEFSIVDLVGSSSTPSVRVMATADVAERQRVHFVYAPLQLFGRGTPAMPIATPAPPRWSERSAIHRNR